MKPKEGSENRSDMFSLFSPLERSGSCTLDQLLFGKTLLTTTGEAIVYVKGDNSLHNSLQVHKVRSDLIIDFRGLPG